MNAILMVVVLFSINNLLYTENTPPLLVGIETQAAGLTVFTLCPGYRREQTR